MKIISSVIITFLLLSSTCKKTSYVANEEAKQEVKVKAQSQSSANETVPVEEVKKKNLRNN